MSIEIKKKPIVKKLSGAGLKVENLETIVNWYGELLNMPIINFDSNVPFYIFDLDNSVNFALDDYRNMKELTKFPIGQFKTGNIEMSYKIVKESDIPILLDIQRPHPGLAYFHVEDSEGNALQVVESDWVNPNPVNQRSKGHPIQNHLQNLIVPVKNLKRATEWYSKFLGIPIIPERQDGGPIYWFDMEDGTGILLDDNRNNGDFDEKFPTVMFGARNIYEAFEFVKQKGIEIVREIQFDHFFVIKDIEENTIMVCQ